jgi:glycosyltransferase involved in cell wall biosynthesis
MNIGLICFAIDPNTGSESQCGWQTAYSLASIPENKVFVFCQPWIAFNTKQLKKAIPNLTIIPYSFNSATKRVKNNNFSYFLYYQKWLNSLSRSMPSFAKEYNLSILHQVTLGDFRFMFLNITTLPFFFGPVGGGQTMPRVFFEKLSLIQKVKERARSFANRKIASSRKYKKKVNNCYKIYAANNETLFFLKDYSRETVNIELFSENGLIENHPTRTAIHSFDEKKLDVLWIGRFIYRKGLSFLLDVASSKKLPKNIRFNLYGEGPEKKKLESAISKRNLTSIVFLYDFIPHNDIGTTYQKNDVFFFPSFRETTGTVLYEAISYGLPVVSFAQFGANLVIKNGENGYLIPVSNNYNQLIETVIDRLTFLQENPGCLLNMSKKQASISENFFWKSKGEKYSKDYILALKQKP